LLRSKGHHVSRQELPRSMATDGQFDVRSMFPRHWNAPSNSIIFEFKTSSMSSSLKDLKDQDSIWAILFSSEETNFVKIDRVDLTSNKDNEMFDVIWRRGSSNPPILWDTRCCSRHAPTCPTCSKSRHRILIWRLDVRVALEHTP